MSFVNALHVASSLPLSDVIVLHNKCCVENKFSSHPPGLLWLGMEGGGTIHGHYYTVCAAQICWPALSPLPLLMFAIYFTVCVHFSDLMRRKTACTANNQQGQRGRDVVVWAFVLCRALSPNLLTPHI